MSLKKINSFRVQIVPRPRKVTVVRPLPHLLVSMQPPIGSLNHLCCLNKRPCLVEELKEESVELLLCLHIGVSPVQLGKKKCLYSRPHCLLCVCFTRVWGLKDDVKMWLHLRHVIYSPVGPVIIEYEDWALKETSLFNKMIYEASEFGTVCGS